MAIFQGKTATIKKLVIPSEARSSAPSRCTMNLLSATEPKTSRRGHNTQSTKSTYFTTTPTLRDFERSPSLFEFLITTTPLLNIRIDKQVSFTIRYSMNAPPTSNQHRPHLPQFQHLPHSSKQPVRNPNISNNFPTLCKTTGGIPAKANLKRNPASQFGKFAPPSARITIEAPTQGQPQT